MTIQGEGSRDWKEAAVDWIGARWQWLILIVVVVFAFNRFAGLAVGIMGLTAFVNRVVGRVLSTRRVVQQVQQIVTDSDDLNEDVEP
ncbi:MAG: hypothetical protein VYD78_08465 [Gemmatimonadota bacterium]|uniref:Uncharacterized protein n=1 Tax=marine metagenome TaxID=408172 RepID=A0A382AVY0_9ZZZZ|nr:hypothetical protein [Gemmatimonadota bacterium]